ncbi:hypothetical protein ACFQ88_32945 [Paenibacillus sp. NPDC056579]|uniref:hypothetical protein n=1 Tax=Paenibacillus sp. NPDC056579 TaxID=3345871 RepID=UPI0036A46EE9
MTDRQKPHWAKEMESSPFIKSRFTKEMQQQVLRKANVEKKAGAARHRRSRAPKTAAAVLIVAALGAAGLWLSGDGTSLLPSWPPDVVSSNKPAGERTQYYENGKLLFSVFPDPELKAGRPYGYLFSFQAPFEELRGKSLAIYAEHVHSGYKVTAAAPAAITEPSSGYQGLERFGVANLGLPLSGLWRYTVELDGKRYGDVTLFVPESSWELSPLFKSGSVELRGTAQNIGFIDPGFRAGAPQKAMWHVWGRDDELKGSFSVKAVKQGEERIIDVLSPLTLGGSVNGADRTAPSMVTLPEQGRWRLLPYIGDRMLDSIVVDVK